jgi:3-dehydroquinate dehydratase/shikimate dehydrogenase
VPDEPTLRTERLLLRPWQPGDREPFAAMSADPRVMEWFPSTLTAIEAAALADRIEHRFHEQGWGLWAVEVPGSAPFIGFVGLNRADEAVGFPSVEVGWRLAAAHWGHGYATEAARAALHHGFDTLRLEEIIAITSVGNTRSRRVMTKLGMVHHPDQDFDHPRLPANSPILRHVLYRIGRTAFSAHEAGTSAFDSAAKGT